MTHEELQSYQERFNEIDKCDEPIRTRRLGSLMNDLELTYNIPILYDREYNEKNEEVMNLYRAVSYARKF
ncbi:hypothetical protein [Oceanobacillus indicireducens]|uniref:Uncharacterized protein n=1 Tax=Oceanobacillus indicireducens TaxID=1004261 RepID=A0A918D2F6_9BACI|nr:hypothetical protein [Oceanobacillus indicireducens]GGN59500.1 hypothetical protein GCM10007971_22690 [Oceanobacillus indicireducens]